MWLGEVMARLSTVELTYGALLLAVFACVVALLFAVRHLLASPANVVRDRLQRVVLPVSAGAPALPVETDGRATSLVHQALAPLARVATPSDEAELGRLRRLLTNAGLRSPQAMGTYLGSKVVLGLLFACLFVWLSAGRALPIIYTAFFTLALLTAGFYLPNLWLLSRVKSRKALVDHAVPDTLDLMVTCIEAGLALDAAVDRVSSEIEVSSPLLAAELRQTDLEMRAGIARGAAFRRLADRTGVDELRSLAAIIVQTEIFGTSVARSLRVQADGMRVRRMRLAEERAATVAVKLVIPLIFCIIPALFSVLLAPAVIRIIRTLLPKLLGE